MENSKYGFLEILNRAQQCSILSGAGRVLKMIFNFKNVSW